MRRALLRSTRANAAVEMALVTPLLLVLLMGSVEVGNYFLDEHRLAKAVRDGARFAARQNFSKFGCSGSVSDPPLTDIKNVVMQGVLSGGTNLLPGWNASTISVTQSCTSTAGGQTMGGIYQNTASGASPQAIVVNVSATVPYVPILKSFGFTGVGFNLNASDQAAVMGV